MCTRQIHFSACLWRRQETMRLLREIMKRLLHVGRVLSFISNPGEIGNKVIHIY